MRRRGAIRGLLGAVLGLGLGLAPAWAADPCAGYVPQPRPQNTARDEVGQDLDEIQERGFLTVAVFEAYPPYSWEDHGAPRGVDVDLARLVAEDLGVEARFTFVEPGETLEADLRNWIWKGPVVGGAVVNLMMRVPYDPAFACRVDQVVFTGRYAQEDIVIGYRDDAYPDDKPVPAYFRYDSVGVENDSIADFYLSGFAGGQMAGNVHHYPAMAGAMTALAAGEVKAVMGPRAQVEWGMAPGLGWHAPPLPGFAKSRWELGVAVHMAYRALGYAVDDAIRAAREDGRVAAIYQAYGLTWQPVEE